MSFKSVLAAAAAAAALSPFAAAAADIEVGQLTCRQTDRTNLVLFSEAEYACVFHPVSGASDSYVGKASKIGVDLSTSKVETMVWFVFAPSADVPSGALAGTYGGVTADASVGVGIGAHVLVGGFDESFALQPAAVSGQEGIGIAAGLERFKLTHRP